MPILVDQLQYQLNRVIAILVLDLEKSDDSMRGCQKLNLHDGTIGPHHGNRNRAKTGLRPTCIEQVQRTCLGILCPLICQKNRDFHPTLASGWFPLTVEGDLSSISAQPNTCSPINRSITHEDRWGAVLTAITLLVAPTT